MERSSSGQWILEETVGRAAHLPGAEQARNGPTASTSEDTWSKATLGLEAGDLDWGRREK